MTDLEQAQALWDKLQKAKLVRLNPVAFLLLLPEGHEWAPSGRWLVKDTYDGGSSTFAVHFNRGGFVGQGTSPLAAMRNLASQLLRNVRDDVLRYGRHDDLCPGGPSCRCGWPAIALGVGEILLTTLGEELVLAEARACTPGLIEAQFPPPLTDSPHDLATSGATLYCLNCERTWDLPSLVDEDCA